MKYTIVGAGAIGGYLGAKLALAGEEVTFIARNRNLAAINARGMTLHLPDGTTEQAKNVRAVQDAAEAGPQDVVLLTTKAHQLLELVPGMQALFGPETMVVSMVNGIPWWYFQKLGGAYDAQQLRSVDPDGALGAGIEVKRIIGGIVYPAAELLEPGVVKVIEGNRFTLGELDNQRTPRIEALSKSMMAAGFKAPVSRDIRSEIWVKLWGNLTFNPVSALSHATLEDICTYPLTRELAQRMMEEAQRVGEKLGVTFKVSVDQRIAGAQAVGAHKTSMLQDVEQGRALELEALLGSVVELARITDTPTPTIDAIYAVTSLLSHTLMQQGGKLAVQRA
jgi:2-dehydropantoate 2-reductase